MPSLSRDTDQMNRWIDHECQTQFYCYAEFFRPEKFRDTHDSQTIPHPCLNLERPATIAVDLIHTTGLA